MFKKSKPILATMLSLSLVAEFAPLSQPAFADSAVNAALSAPSGIEIPAVSQTSISLKWNSVDGAANYNVYRAKLGYKDYQLIGSTQTTEYTDATVEKDSSYLYKISAVNSSGEGNQTAEVLGMTQWSFPNLISKIDISAAGTGNRMRIGDMDGDGRYDLLMVQPAYVKDDARNPRYVAHLAAYDIEGKLLWEQGTVDPRVTTSGADEPVQIYDIDADGENEVLTVMQMGDDTEKYFYIFNGKTGEIKKKFKLPSQRAHDAIFIANFSGNPTPQDILLKDRYSDIWALDKDGNQLWHYAGNTGHGLLPYDFDGDGRDELVNNYSLISHDGKELWRKDLPAHVDTHWVADINDDGKMEIILGGEDTYAFDVNGNLLFRNGDTVEPQQILVGDYRIDSPGLELAGLDRVNRGNPGQDGMFLFTSKGETLYHEQRAKGDWGSIVRPLDNWTGSYAPLITAYRRGKDADHPNGVVPKLYDGYFNPIVTFDGHTDAKEQVMVADMAGDSRDELIVYNLTGDLSAYVYSNGPSNLKEHITGVTRMSDFRNYNFSRYDSRRYDLTIKNLVPAGIKAAVNNSADIDVSWIPVLGIEKYNIYRSSTPNGEYTKVGTSTIPEFTDSTAPIGTSYYKVTAVNSEGESNLPIVAAEETINSSGILAPVITDESKSYKAGSTIPVKFQLTDKEGNYLTGATAKIYVEDANGVSTSAAVKDNQFRYDADANQYIFNLSTKAMSAGKYKVRVDVGDRTIYSFPILLK
ncbi:rhamnogalacturonan lyase family protein [Neobacillus dielmonensis]|uniref:rhamnogalacturonan lyase family protein n=1 Tax=Neobacillus dielmonensis TaxID=1347369 RepID=UPI000694D3CD|nr:PxKF domain-containing protein [Neobacillus dielmonensis]